MSASAANGTVPVGGSGGGPAPNRPPLTVGSMLVCVHGILDMPRTMAQVDPRREESEIVLKPKAKYYYNDHKVTYLDLPEATISFSPSSIIFKNERFVVDFDSPSTTSRGGSPRQRAAGHEGDASLLSSAADPPALQGGSPQILRPRDVVGLDDLDAGGGGGALPRRPAHHVLLQYPKRSDLKVIIEILVSVRQRRLHSAAARWITPAPELGSVRNEIASFSAADGEVARFKVLNRFVGLTVGHMSCTMQVPHVREDLTQLPNAHALQQAAFDRLAFDHERLRKMYACEQLEGTGGEKIRRRLASGESELSIFKSFLLTAHPQYYIERVAKIVEMYPPTAQNQPWVMASPAELVANAGPGGEEELIRHLCAELGPEPSSSSPRTRRLVFRWFYRLREEDLRLCVSQHFNNLTDLLDNEPDLYMQVLAERFGAELPPPRYNFPMVAYEPDNRTYFCDALRFPASSGDSQQRDAVLAARAVRVPLSLTPNERPLEAPPSLRAGGRRVTEVDILTDKYKPEFAQIIPSIAEAMETVTAQNEQLMAAAGRSPAQPEGDFAMFHSEHPTRPYTRLLATLADNTYISPSSLLATLIYLDRLCMSQASFFLTRYNIERLMVTATRVASKVVDLRSVSNRNFAAAFQLATADMNAMEEQLLKLLNFDFFLGPDEFFNYAHLLDPPQAPRTMRTSLRRGAEESLDLATARSAPVLPPAPSTAHGGRRRDSGQVPSSAGRVPRTAADTAAPPLRPSRHAHGPDAAQPAPPPDRPPPPHRLSQQQQLRPDLPSSSGYGAAQAPGGQVSLSNVVVHGHAPNEDLEVRRGSSACGDAD